METTNYCISEKRRAVWNAELELFKVFKDICDRHNLSYFADGGTLLGAVRHKGFIPWDDDLDVSMLREDYDKFIEYAQKELGDQYYLQIPKASDDYFYGHAKIRKNNTTAIRYIQYPEKYKQHQGVFIDVFPLDNVPDNKLIFRIHRFVSIKLMQIVYYAKYYYRLNPHSVSAKLKHRICLILVPSNKAAMRAFKVFEWWYRLPNNKVTKRVGTTSTYYYIDEYIWPRNWFKKGVELKFENISIQAPHEYHKLLTQVFGDYNKPVITPSIHGEVFFDLEHNYTDYYDGTRSFSREDMIL